METSFLVIGLACTATVGLLGRLVYRYTRCLISSLKVPLRIHIRPKISSTWNKPKQVRQLREALEKDGFRSIGNFEVPEMPYLSLAAFTDRQGASAVVYDHLLAGTGVDLFLRCGERGGVTVSNMKAAQGLEPPPWTKKLIFPQASLEELVSVFRRETDEIPAHLWFPTTIENFATFFENSYADEIDWRNGRGGPTIAEVALQSPGAEENSEVVLKSWKDLRRAAHVSFHSGMALRFRKEYRTYSHLEDEDLLFLYESLTMEQLENVLAQHLRDERKSLTVPRLCEPMEPRTVFERLQELLPPGNGYEKLGELEFPHHVEVFLRPPHGLPSEIFQFESRV